MNKEQRIGTAFHESFALNIPAIATVLRVCDEHDGELSADTILAETTLGADYVDAMPNYARGIGFLEIGTLNLTPLAREVLRKDPNLTRRRNPLADALSLECAARPWSRLLESSGHHSSSDRSVCTQGGSISFNWFLP